MFYEATTEVNVSILYAYEFRHLQTVVPSREKNKIVNI